MSRTARLAACAAMFASVSAEAGTPVRDCSLGGEVVQWIADYCMLALQTDDEIAASRCIEEHLARRFPSECDARTHYKRAMCGLHVAGGASGQALEACMSDPDFMGRAVRHGGVGG